MAAKAIALLLPQKAAEILARQRQLIKVFSQVTSADSGHVQQAQAACGELASHAFTRQRYGKYMRRR